MLRKKTIAGMLAVCMTLTACGGNYDEYGNYTEDGDDFFFWVILVPLRVAAAIDNSGDE